jgi:hypothetical protein
MPDTGASRKRQISGGRISDDLAICRGSGKAGRTPRASARSSNWTIERPFDRHFVLFAQHPPKNGRLPTVSGGSFVA